MCLPFLPVDEILPNFLEITENCPSHFIMFLKYVDETFIRGKCIRHIARLNKSTYSKPKYGIQEWIYLPDLKRKLNEQLIFMSQLIID